MDDVATKIIDILKQQMKEPPEELSLETPLADLGIESIDFAMIMYEIEDAFSIEVPYNANEEQDAFATVGTVVEKIKEVIAETQAA